MLRLAKWGVIRTLTAHEHKAFEEFKKKSGLVFKPVAYSLQQVAFVAEAREGAN
jgi:hypothetical protein